MKFCILMPAYNAEKDIKNAVNSILKQTYKDFSLIVVNDGSTDKTLEMLSEFLYDDRIKVLSQDNTGIAGAYKNAFQYLDGEYIMFLDSDDKFDINVLQDINDIIEKNDSDIVQFGISYFDEDWKYIRDLSFCDKELSQKENILENYFEGINDGTNRPNLGIRAYKKFLFDDFEFPSIESLGIDEILNLYAISNCNKITFVSKCYYLCQQRIESVSRIKPSLKKVKGILLSYTEMEKIVSKKCPEFKDMLYVKFVKFHIAHLNLIKKLPDYKLIEKSFKEQLRIIKRSHRVKLNLKEKIRIFLISYFPYVSLFISKN